MFCNLIFDWSGTLVDDLGPVLDATNAVFAAHGREPMSREEFQRRFRLPYEEFYEECLPGVPIGELEKLFRPAFAASRSPVTVLPHAREKLEWCQRHGIRCFVLTSMDEEAFHGHLEEFGVGHLFEATYAGVLDKREMIGELLERHCLDPMETAFIGDMNHDVLTARHGGVTSVAVLTGYTSAAALAESRPDLMVPDLGVLCELFERGIRVTAEDRIQIRDLRVSTRLGVPEAERAAPQTVSVSVVMEPRAGFAELDDRLEGTVDYHAAVLRISELAATGERRLAETLAVEIAEMLIGEFPLKGVEVSLEKAILLQAAGVGVRVRRP